MFYADAGFSAETELSIGLSEIYSSNIFLFPDDDAISDFVTRINPSIMFSEEGRAIDFSASYNYEYLFYADNSDFNQDYHQLESNLLARLIGDELTASGEVIYSQLNVDPLQPITDSNVNVTGNRSNGMYWNAGLNWRRKLPLNSEIDAAYLYGGIDYEDEGLQEVDTQTVSVTIASDSTVASRLTYALDYNYWFYDYETSGDIRDQNLSLTLRQEVSYGFDLLGLVGLDSDFTDPQDSTMSEGRWEVGFETSSNKGQLLAMFGHRYFGNVLRLKAGRAVTDWYVSASYVEEPGTAESVFLREGAAEVPIEPDGGVAEPLPPTGIDQPGSALRFFRKRADGGLSWQGYKSLLSFSVWWDKRENLPTDDPTVVTPPGDDESLGSLLNYEWEVGARSTASFAGSWFKRKFSEPDPDDPAQQEVFNTIDYFRLSAGLSYQLGLKTSLGTTAGFIKSSGDVSEDNYKEFQVSIELLRTF